MKIYVSSLFLILAIAVFSHDSYTGIQYDTIPDVDPNLLSLDIYVPDDVGTELLPVIIYIHGGGWSTGDKTNTAFKDEIFTDSGYVFVSVNYRLSPHPNDTLDPDRIAYPIHPYDIGRAVSWVYENIGSYNGDSSRIGLIGHSAGAHLVALVGSDSRFIEEAGSPFSLVKAVIPLDGGGLDIPYHLDGASPEHRALYVNAFTSDTSIWREASPIEYITPETPPFKTIFQATVPRIDLHQRFKDELDLHGVPNDYWIAEWLDHSQINRFIGAFAYIDTTDSIEAISETITAEVMSFFNDYVRDEMLIVDQTFDHLHKSMYIVAYPNPFIQQITIDLLDDCKSIRIRDIMGNTIFKENLNRSNRYSQQIKWRPSETTESGVYLIEIALLSSDVICQRVFYVK